MGPSGPAGPAIPWVEEKKYNNITNLRSINIAVDFTNLNMQTIINSSKRTDYWHTFLAKKIEENPKREHLKTFERSSSDPVYLHCLL